MSPTRRALLRGAGATGAAGAAATVVGAAAPAQAARIRRHRGGPRLLGPAERHLVTRFSYGIDTRLAADVRRAGGARAWWERQLAPASIADPDVAAYDEWYPSLWRGPQDLWQRTVSEVEPGWRVMQDYQRWLLLRRMTTRRQLHEVMTEFWEGHLHVAVAGDASFTYRVPYGQVIRTHALGRFADLLHATTTHPAMGIFLDNATSTARHPNENLGRELLELHTVGRGLYGEEDVKASARILTGWKVDVWRSWNAGYDPTAHWVGPVTVMDFTDANAASDGRALTRRYTDYLARHPATAQRICRRLAIKFVGDDPSPALVDRLAGVYLASDTAIIPVLRALIDSPEFTGSVGGKVRDPGEDLVATYRVLGARVLRPTAEDSAAQAMLWQCANLGAIPFGWARPDGPPITDAAWSSTSRMLGSFRLHHSVANGYWPTRDVAYRSPRSWLPDRRVRFDVLVDSLSRRLLHRPVTRTLLDACCQAVECRPREIITPRHQLVTWKMGRLLATLLDSPDHMTR